MRCRNEDCGPTLQCQDSLPLHQERRHQYESISAKKTYKKTKKLDLKLCGMRGNEIRWQGRIWGGGGEGVGSRLTFRKHRFFFIPQL